METKFKVSIPQPCHEDWNKMTPDETGRFCSVCTKGVVDFTHKNSTEIQEYLIQNKGQKVCGRFRNEQINKFDIQIPQSVLTQRRSFHKAFLLALFVVMGSTLFSCKNHNNGFLGEVIIDTTEINHTTGVILPPKDSIPKEKDMTVGKINIERYDSLVKAGVKMPPLPPPPKVNQVKFTKTENK
ncbi:MAG: hypothetical protein V4572_08850 [Bacteroidota bacterium]